MIAISPAEFFQAFLRAWANKRADPEITIAARFASPRKSLWTPVMCGAVSSPLDKTVGEPLVKMTLDELSATYVGLSYDPERHTVDAFGRIPRGNPVIPASHVDQLNVVMIEVEHEAGKTGEEFWKLLHSRVPLKVLITYDNNKRGTIDSTCERLASMHSSAIRILGPDPTNYLLIFGGRKDFKADAEIVWKPFHLVDGAFAELQLQ